jgi:hypothetical protein
MGSMFHILGYSVLPLTVFVSGLALWKGAGAERHGAVTLVLSMPAQWALISLFSSAGVERLLVAIYTDIVLSLSIGLSFLFAAMRYQSPWLGVAFMLQGIELGVSAFVLGENANRHVRAYFLALNVISLSTLSVLLCATVQTIGIRQRRGLTAFEKQGDASIALDAFRAVIEIFGPRSPRREGSVDSGRR